MQDAISSHIQIPETEVLEDNAQLPLHFHWKLVTINIKMFLFEDIHESLTDVTPFLHLICS